MGYASSDPSYHHALAGAASGCLSRFICQPFDVVKIRFQLQLEPIKKNSVGKYKSMSQTFRLIVKEEKIFALWKGHVPAQILSVVYGTSQFYTYTIINKHLEQMNLLSDKTKTVHFISGAIAGSFGTILSFPLDTIRTRLIAQSSQHMVYTGICNSCSTIYKTESPKAFFRGLLPTLLQIAPHAGLQFETYELVKDIKFLPANTPEDSKHHKRVGLVNSLVAGCIAGLVAKTAVYPFDLARKRLQIQGFEHGRKGFDGFFRCNGLIDCLINTVKNEGVQGLFKGLVPSQYKAALMTALHFTCYEQALNFIRSFNETD